MAFTLATASLAAVPPAGADPQAERAALMAERRSLISQIAALVDHTTAARADAVVAAGRLEAAEAALRQARAVVRSRAVDAYVWGTARSVASLRSPSIYLTQVARFDSDALAAKRQAVATAEVARAAAETAIAGATVADEALAVAQRRLAATDEPLADLDAAIEANRIAREAALADADAALAKALAPPTARSVRATEDQLALMARLPFGPADRLPAAWSATDQHQVGVASWYGPGFDGRPTATGAIYDQLGWTIAHRTLPLGTVVWLRRADDPGGAGVVALVNDRGPYIDGRIWDLSRAVAEELGVTGLGQIAGTVVVEAPA